MSPKEKLLSIVLTVVFSVFALIPIFEEKIEAKEPPKELFQVYLDDKSIGVIKSKVSLESYINKEQKDLKERYNINNVYLPEGLYIEKYVGYTKDITTESEIYKKIKDIKPFTIKGFVVSINSEKPIKINVLNKTHFENAINSTVKAFVSESDFKAFLNDEIEEIKTTGEKIEDLYIKEKITIKESLIPSDEKIFDNEKELTQYLLFGNLDTQKEYVVKQGDTIESIAFSNSLGIEEFLVVNPQFNNENNLLFAGQKVNVDLISPIISVVVEEHRIEDKVIPFKTDVKYDSSVPFGTNIVTQQGENGLQRVTQKIYYKNGDIIEALIVNPKEELKASINKVIVKGTYSEGGPVVIGDDGVWAWPTITPYIITSSYGYRWGVIHEGTDISGCGSGSPIFAANSGNVYSSGYDSTGGNQVIINHNNGYYTIYAHMLKLYVTTGQAVTRGQIIGLMGSTGYSTGTHLHFGVYQGVPYRGGRSFNAMTLFR